MQILGFVVLNMKLGSREFLVIQVLFLEYKQRMYFLRAILDAQLRVSAALSTGVTISLLTKDTKLRLRRSTRIKTSEELLKTLIFSNIKTTLSTHLLSI
jgi:hypothetical protein